MRNLVLGALAVLCVAGCAKGRGGGGSDGGGGGAGAPAKPPMSIVVTPATSTIALQPAGNAKFSGSVQLVATATYADGTTGDVSAAAIWTASEPSVSVNQGNA